MPRLSSCAGSISYRPLRLIDGDHSGTAPTPGGIGLAEARELRRYVDPHATSPVPRQFVQARWRSPVVEPGFAFTQLVPTWHARTPGASWVEVSARVRSPDAGWSRWLVLARWADHDTALHPTSVPGERASRAISDGDWAAEVATDTVVVSGGCDAWQLQFCLLAPGGGSGPVLSYAAAMVSEAGGGTGPDPGQVPGLGAAGTPGSAGAAGVILDVPTLSQRVHAGHYPRWGGGGDSWCSPTSMAMVLAFWGTGPDRESMTWVEPHYPDPPVYHAVRHCWDHAYAGAGNWSFNTAYAARFGLGAFVTRLRGLAEAEAFVRAGIPLIASVQVRPEELAGSEYASHGHLVVITGFTNRGDVVVNDPGATDPRTVRRVYRRQEFDRAWQVGSGRVVYVVHPPEVELPPRPDEPNW